MRGRYWMAAIIALVPSIPRPGGACLDLPARPFTPAPIAGDTTPPRDLSVEVEVSLGNDRFVACRMVCPNSPSLQVRAVATDDHTLAHAIGYRLRALSGDVPPSLASQLDETYVDDGLAVTLYFDPEDLPFAFQLEIVALDESGNETAPIVRHVAGRLPTPELLWPGW